MLSEKAVFRSAFTPEGWVEPLDGSHLHTVLLHTPPVAATETFWRRLHGPLPEAASEIFLDPLAHGWWEGFALYEAAQPCLLLKSDGLHPRSLPLAPFGDDFVDLFGCLQPLSAKARSCGPVLLQRQQQALRCAQNQLEAARAVLGDNLRLAAARLRTDAVEQLADTLYRQVLQSPRVLELPPAASIRFFSAPGALPGLACAPALRARADRFIFLPDEYGAAARMILHLLARRAKREQEPLCIGRCPLFWPDKIDHLVFMARRVAVVTVNRHHRLAAAGRPVDCAALQRPFTEAECQRLQQHARRGAQLLGRAGASLREVWRLQAALASLCPLRLGEAAVLLCGRSSMIAKNIVET